MTAEQLKKEYEKRKISLIRKDKSKWMKIYSWLLGLIGVKDYMTRYWTTAGNSVYYPTNLQETPDISFFKKFYPTLMHELEHVKQKDKYTLVGFTLLYALFPVPIFFAYFRWKSEREAYMHNIRAGRTIEQSVNSLWSAAYFWPWPKSWMRKWFEKEVKKENLK